MKTNKQTRWEKNKKIDDRVVYFEVRGHFSQVNAVFINIIYSVKICINTNLPSPYRSQKSRPPQNSVYVSLNQSNSQKLATLSDTSRNSLLL